MTVWFTPSRSPQTKYQLIQYRDEDLSYFENMSGPDSEKIKKTYLKSSKTMN